MSTKNTKDTKFCLLSALSVLGGQKLRAPSWIATASQPMWSYIARRILLTIPTVFGIVLLTFILFALVSKDPARAYAGKQANETTLRAIRHKMGLDKPRFVNVAAMKQ